MKSVSKAGILILAALLLVLPLLAGCGGNGDEDGGEVTGEVVGDVVITIGNLTDLTGATASAMELINLALKDMIDYYNTENLIPGVELKVREYDTTYDPSRYNAGYEWLKEKGMDVVWTPVPGASQVIRARVDKDEMVVFTPSAAKEELVPPGHVFMPSTIPDDNSYTLLKWIAENDWDYETNGPAKVGAAAWITPYNESLHNAAEEYCRAHPDQFTWVGSYRSDFKFTWGTEVEALKDCDYVMVPINLGNFAKEYRQSGYGAKFLGTGAQAAFLGLVHAASMWDEIDGMLFAGIMSWWNDDTEVAGFINDILHRYHPDSAEQIIRGGSGYMSVDSVTQMLEIIKNAVESVGPENFDSAALYEAAQAYSQTADGIARASFTENKRASVDFVAIYEADGEAKDLFMVGDEFYPVVREP